MVYFVDCAVRKRDHEQVAVWPGFNIGNDAEVPSEQQAFAFGDVELTQVVGYPILKSWIVDTYLLTVTGKIKVKQVSAGEGGPGCSNKKVVVVGASPSRAYTIVPT